MRKKKKLKQLFSKEKEKYILDNYLTMDYESIADKIGCKRHNIVYFLKRNNLEGKKRKLQLNSEQMEFLEENYHKYTKYDLAKMFKIPANSIAYYVKLLGLNGTKKSRPSVKPLKSEQKEYILENYKKESYAQIAKTINSNKNQINHFISEQGLSGYKDWTLEKDSYLKENYLVKTDKELSQILPHKESAILARRIALGLKKETDFIYSENSKDNKTSKRTVGSYPRSKKHWTDKELQYLKENYLTKSDSELSAELGRSKKAVKHQRVNFKWFRESTRSNHEIEIENFLIKNKVDYESQFFLNGYSFDFKIGNTLVEINGDYYHCNPSVYPNGPINKHQLYTIQKDNEKIKMIESSEYEIVIIWEKDFLENKSKILNSLLAVS